METLEDRGTTGIFVLAFHCVICGDIVDDVIIRHRTGFRPA